MRGKTQAVGEKTAKHTRFTQLAIGNKDPDFDYSYQRIKDIQQGGGSSSVGWEAIGEHNYNGETFGNLPKQLTSRMTGSKKEHTYMDTVAAKRHKDVTKFFKVQENEQYNSQIKMINSASKRVKKALRELDPESVVTDQSSHRGPGMTQRKGPTEEEN